MRADPAYSAAAASQEEFTPPKPPPVPFPKARNPNSTVNLRAAAPPPMVEPRYTPLARNPRPSLGDRAQEVDENALKKAFEKPVRHQEGAVICRFCRGPLFLGGEFCEHCGAPVAEAAPPGLVPPQPANAEPPITTEDDDPLARILNPAPASPVEAPTGPISAAPHVIDAPLPPVRPPVQAPPPQPRPHNPYLTSTPAPQEDEPGLMGRLKGIFKKS
jgi:hypothetical protein